MTRNYQLWRANIRRSYERGYSSRRHRGAWSNPNGDYVLTQTSGFAGWRHFGPVGSLLLTLTESYAENQSLTTTYNDGTPTSSRTQIWTGVTEVEAVVERARVNLLWSTLTPSGEATPEADPLPRAYHYHISATPYGEGLYNCLGTWIIYAPTRTATTYTDTSPIIPDDSTDETELKDYRFDYSTLGERIRGLSTRSRWTARQGFHGPAIAFRQDVTIIEDNPGYMDDSFLTEDIPFLPAETDPDGLPGTEVYWTDTALRAMVNGEFSDEMDVVSGGAGRSVPSYDDTSNIEGDSWSHTWTRAGTLLLKFFHSAAPPPP